MLSRFRLSPIMKPIERLLLAVLLLMTSAYSRSAVDVPQIQQGLKVHMASEMMRAERPNEKFVEFAAIDNLASILLFYDAESLFRHFASLPEMTRLQGLWVTWTPRGIPEKWMSIDRRRVDSLAAAARARGVPLHLCEPTDSKTAYGRWVGWQCTVLSPGNTSARINCDVSPATAVQGAKPVYECRR